MASLQAMRKEIALRKTLCGIAAGALTFALPGVASAQLVETGDIEVSPNVAASAPITDVASGNNVGLLNGGDQTTGDHTNEVNSNATAGDGNTTQAGDNTTNIDDRDTVVNNNGDTKVVGNNNTVNSNNRTSIVEGDGNTTVTGDENLLNQGNDNNFQAGENNTLVDGDGNTVVHGDGNRLGSDDISIVNRDGTVAFANRDGTVTITDRFGKHHVLSLKKAVLVGVLPARFLTHKHVLFPHRIVAGKGGVGGGELAKTGQELGLLVLAALAMITAGYVVTRVTRQDQQRLAAAPTGPAPITLVVADPDAVDTVPEPPVEVDPSERSLVKRAWEAASSELETEIATLRRQLAELVPAGSGVALAG